jgi:queuine tRNA-ribosyltransferase
MPVGTHASVRGQRRDDLVASGAQVLLANTYHLLLRPGPELFEKLGGIHAFMNWPRSVLTDSGGFQIFSLPNSRNMGEDGAAFKSYVDNSLICLSPERSIAMQKAIGSDIMMVLDQCVPSTVDRTIARHAMELTHRWAQRCSASCRERATPTCASKASMPSPRCHSTALPSVAWQSARRRQNAKTAPPS